jgi:hypothetical protein
MCTFLEASLLSKCTFDPATGLLDLDKPFAMPSVQFLEQIPHADRRAFMHRYDEEASVILARAPEHRSILHLGNLAHSAFANVAQRAFHAISSNAGIALNMKVGGG